MENISIDKSMEYYQALCFTLAYTVTLLLILLMFGCYGIMDIINKLKKWYLAKDYCYEYGVLKSSGTKARWNRYTKEIQFVLWKAGEQGHKHDWYCKVGSGHKIRLTDGKIKEQFG